MAGTSPALKHLQARQHRGVFFPLFAKGVWGCGRAGTPAHMGRIRQAQELNFPGMGQLPSHQPITATCLPLLGWLPPPRGGKWTWGQPRGQPTVCGVARRETRRKKHRWKGDAR